MGRAHLIRSSALALAALALCACPPEPAPTPDAGPVDAGPQPPGCDTPEDCRAAGFDGVCRAQECLLDVPCLDDVECGIGERCVQGLCRFRGCTADADCGSGRCRAESFSCAECGRSSDCPSDRPVCDVLSNACVQCSSDLECPFPGPGHCDRGRGACTWCLEDKQCPNGLTCGPGGICKGAQKGLSCLDGVACGEGLACVQLGGVPICLETCSLYISTACPTGEVCFKLTFTDTASLVFEDGAATGVCYTAQSGLRGVNELCVKSGSASSCQPNLECVPESATASRCRRYCDPSATVGCVAPDTCHPFVGDYWSNRYGICYPDNGFGAVCANELACRPLLACMAYDDPSKTDLLSPLCQFAVGAQPALGPCAPGTLPDAGVLPAGRACRSGACVGDPLVGSNDFFCFGPCGGDLDCSVGGRQGYCDTTFDFNAAGSTDGGITGTLKGCRPRCDDEAACGEYDAGFTCRVRLQASSAPLTKLTCGNPLGLLRAGESCSVNSQCRSGYCDTTDSRGVLRRGTCVEACNDAADCAAVVVDGGLPDGGAALFPLACANTALLGFRGFDNVAGTPDDKFVTASLCQGAGCASDEACGDVDAGTAGRCVPGYPAANPGLALELRCRGTSLTGTLEAGDTCGLDSDCRSGVCGTQQTPSLGTGKTCLRSCDPASVCPSGLTCRDGSLRVDLALGGTQALRSCTP